MNATENHSPLTAIEVCAGVEGAPDASARSAGASGALPCLYNHNCITKDEKSQRIKLRLTPNQKRVRAKLIIAIERMVRKYGLEKVGPDVVLWCAR